MDRLSGNVAKHFLVVAILLIEPNRSGANVSKWPSTLNIKIEEATQRWLAFLGPNMYSSSA